MTSPAGTTQYPNDDETRQQAESRSHRIAADGAGVTFAKLTQRSPSDELKYVQDVNLKLLAVNAELLAALWKLDSAVRSQRGGVSARVAMALSASKSAIAKAEELTRG